MTHSNIRALKDYLMRIKFVLFRIVKGSRHGLMIVHLNLIKTVFMKECIFFNTTISFIRQEITKKMSADIIGNSKYQIILWGIKMI